MLDKEMIKSIKEISILSSEKLLFIPTVSITMIFIYSPVDVFCLGILQYVISLVQPSGHNFGQKQLSNSNMVWLSSEDLPD